MPKFVVNVDPSPRTADLGRAQAMIDRLGSRQGDSRNMDALFAFLIAARGRYQEVGRVRKHVCLHEEGFGDCSSLTVEG